MNNKLLSAVVMAAGVFTLQASVTTTPLPTSVTSTSPSQGLVDTSPNAYPLGVGEISIFFKSNPVVNPSSTGVAYCYMDDVIDPVATATVANAYVDAMGDPIGGLSFKKKILTPGEYTVTIPEGFWLIDNGASLSPALELHYEILNIYTVFPRSGIVNAIEEIHFIFPEADEVVRNTQITPEFFLNNSDNVYGMAYDYAPGEKRNEIIITFPGSGQATSQITKPGVYLFFAPADAFTMRTYGPNYESDPTDFTEMSTPEIRLQYQIPSFPAPEIEPSQGIIKQFDTFTLTVTDEMELLMVDDMAGSFIYEILPDGTLADNPLCRLKAARVPDTNQFTMTVVGESPVVPAKGEYMLRLANNLFSGMMNNEFTSSVAYEYLYKVEDSVGIETMGEIISESNTVYTFNGIKILEAAGADKVRSLPAGFYIVNGSKVIIR